jgi:hypothetical protein
MRWPLKFAQNYSTARKSNIFAFLPLFGTYNITLSVVTTATSSKTCSFSSLTLSSSAA